ncbi:serine/threonine protein kinase [Nostocales cyanobacterium HT-58-2]|nr:serine/threonine protein kinase [Nostocales cyanobacterium HT-58-2]
MLAEINPGTLINNRYQIQRILGQGGFGRTYLAVDTQRFGDLCVLKEFVPINRAEHILLKSRELFEREAKILYQINHPQIPKFLAWLTEKQRLLIVEEYIEGKTYAQLLRDALKEPTPLQHPFYKREPFFSETEVIQWLLDLLPVLDYLHQQNIIHRDISLDNLIFSSKLSKPVLIDFGVVKQKFTQILTDDSQSSNAGHSVAGSVVGKVGYSPPEQIHMGRCYPCSDLYALGVCAVVLLTGKTPRSLLDGNFKWQWRSCVNVSDSLAQILDKMLAEKPANRYQSAREIQNILQPLLLSRTQDVSVSSQNVRLFPDTINKLKLETPEPEAVQGLNQKLQESRQNHQPASQFKKKHTTGINREFLEYCHRELTTFIGPFASVLIENTLMQTPQITPREFVEKLAAAIPHHQRAYEFRNSIQIPPEPEETTSSQEMTNTYYAASNPEFLLHCRQELTSFIGPFASFVIEDALAQNPQLTLEQLVDVLVGKIPHPQRAEEFRKRIHFHY